MKTRYDHVSGDGQMRYICLIEPITSLEMCLVGHAESSGEPLTELRTGLDRLEFLRPASCGDLDAWAERLDELEVQHSGVRDVDYTANAMITFREPTSSNSSSSGERLLAPDQWIWARLPCTAHPEMCRSNPRTEGG